MSQLNFKDSEARHKWKLNLRKFILIRFPFFNRTLPLNWECEYAQFAKKFIQDSFSSKREMYVILMLHHMLRGSTVCYDSFYLNISLMYVRKSDFQIKLSLSSPNAKLFDFWVKTVRLLCTGFWVIFTALHTCGLSNNLLTLKWLKSWNNFVIEIFFNKI